MQCLLQMCCHVPLPVHSSILSDTKTYTENFQLSEISKIRKGIDDDHYRLVLKEFKKVHKVIH